jgi:hypothetical protein
MRNVLLKYFGSEEAHPDFLKEWPYTIRLDKNTVLKNNIYGFKKPIYIRTEDDLQHVHSVLTGKQLKPLYSVITLTDPGDEVEPITTILK